MAVIGTIRKQSGLLIIIIGVALAAFVLGDFLNPRGGSRQVINIAEVLGEEINYTYFDAKYEQNLENQKRNQQQETLTPEETYRLKQQTFDQIVQSIILQKEYEKLGITVTADELFNQIQGDNPHAYILQFFKNPETELYDPELANVYFHLKRFADARSACYATLKVRPNDGKVYILIGDLYASSAKKCGEGDFFSKVAYWPAVDKYIKAKNVDPEVADLARTKINTFIQYFPATEQIFFHDLKAGDSFTVECWINETTTVRASD